MKCPRAQNSVLSSLALNSICIQWLPNVWLQSSPNESHTLNSNWFLGISSWMSNENSNINMDNTEPLIAYPNWGVSHLNCSWGKNKSFCTTSYFSSTQQLLLILYTFVLSFHFHCKHLAQIPPLSPFHQSNWLLTCLQVLTHSQSILTAARVVSLTWK